VDVMPAIKTLWTVPVVSLPRSSDALHQECLAQRCALEQSEAPAHLATFSCSSVAHHKCASLRSGTS